MTKTDTYYHLLPFVILFYIANNFLLPHGLLYTTLLTPVFLYWLYKKDSLPSLLKWSILLFIPVPFQLYGGPEVKSFLISTTLVFTAWIFLFTALQAVKELSNKLARAFKSVLLINSVLILLALLILPFPPIRDLMWYSIPISPDIPAFPRLKLLAYEPSHYALLLSPIFLFFLLKVFTGRTKHPLLVLTAVSIPLILSLSFGVIGAMIVAIMVATIVYFRFIPKTYQRFIFYGSLLILLIFVSLYFIWPENPVYVRINNILTGSDTSAKGRLRDSFMFAFDLINQHKLIMGIGPGQIKVMAHDLIINYYKYTGEFAEIVRIPNAMGEMLATYGFYGFVLKVFFEVYFFVRLKIYKSIYSLVLFIFIFVYQFTGSFLINVAELGIWAVVFQNRLDGFNIHELKKLNS